MFYLIFDLMMALIMFLLGMIFINQTERLLTFYLVIVQNQKKSEKAMTKKL